MNIASKYFRDNEFLDLSLKNSQLYFSNLNQFNDPYERFLKLKKTKWNEIIVDYGSDVISTLSGKEIDDYFIQRQEFIEDYTINQFGVCCFTDLPNNHLLWSHYSDSYKGVCLMFDFIEDENLFENLGKVEYQDEIPQLDIFSKNNLIDERYIVN